MQAGPPSPEVGGLVLAAVERTIVQYLDGEPQRASVSFVGVDPIQVLRFADADGAATYASLGMSRTPMSGADQRVTTPDGPRAELVLAAGAGFDRVWAKLAILAAAPAVEGVVYRPDMTVDLGAALVDGSSCTGVVVAAPLTGPIDTPGGPVDLLAVLPATSVELAWCRVRGAAALRDRWAEQGTDLRDLRRPSVDLG